MSSVAFLATCCGPISIVVLATSNAVITALIVIGVAIRLSSFAEV